MAKNKALLKKNTYHSILHEINRLRAIGVEELRKLIGPQQVSQFQPLFSKFETLSKKDEEAIAEDEELLRLITALRDKLDKQSMDE